MMKSVIVLFAVIAMINAVDVKFNDLFGGVSKISIPSCKAEPCNLVQGVPLPTLVTFAADSPKWDQGKGFKKFTTGYLAVTITDGYGNKFGEGLLTGGSDLTKYDSSFPLKPKQVSTAKISLLAPKIDPKVGPFKSTGKKAVQYLINVGNATDFITVGNPIIYLNVIH